jgi:cephalosporin hydroxylase
MIYQNEIEFQELVELFRQLSPRQHVLEIGSLVGESLIPWMKHCSPGSSVISIDLVVPAFDPRHPVQAFGHSLFWPAIAEAYGLKFLCLDCDSRSPELVSKIRLMMPEIDFLFIDGGHDYATCLSDWNNYGPLVRKGGMVAFHDLGREWPDVRKVWEQVRQGYNYREIVQSPERYGIGVLYK